MDKKVVTVTGLIDLDQLGKTDAHNHLWISDLGLDGANIPVLNQENLIIEDLCSYKSSGGSSQVDCQPGRAGRDGRKLYSISKTTGVNIIACTGFHLSEYYPPGEEIWSLDADQARDYFLNEIQTGLIETQDTEQLVFPGFIKIAVRETISESPRSLLEGAVAASQESGYLIEMHTEKGVGVEEFLDYFSSQGLAPERLVICHIDKRTDLGLHMELAQEGYLLEYDTFFRKKYLPEENLWMLIHEMVQAGQEESIALATDLADSSQWVSYGGEPGLAGFMNIINDRLRTVFDQPVIDQMMGKNIGDRLAVKIKENSV